MGNFDMQLFYMNFLDQIKSDQARYDGNHEAPDHGPLADVVPYDGIGGNPGCPIWQVAYIVIARNMWKHYGEDAIPTLKKHFGGMQSLFAWFTSHADPSDGLLVIKCYGDWMGFNPESGNRGSSHLTPQDSVTAYHHTLAASYMHEISTAIGNATAAAAYLAKYNALRVAYHKR